MQKLHECQITTTGQKGTVPEPREEVLVGYAAPFPDESYKACARVLTTLVPIRPGDPAAGANRRAWRALHRFEKPFTTAPGPHATVHSYPPLTRAKRRAPL